VAIEIASTPKIQTVGPRIVVHGDRSTLELGTAMFTITVKNAGAVGLSGVNVTDPRSPACNRKLGTLAAGASISYRCSARRVARSHRNVVTVSGRPSTGARDLARAGALATATAGSLVRVRARVTSRAGVPLFTG
jgi:uncharacterized repeat protein (TIGR01451 family)